MNEKKYVQHVSGVGAKYEVRTFDESRVSWQTYSRKDRDLLHYLPKDEYVLCCAPDIWTEITSECEVLYAEGAMIQLTYNKCLIDWGHGFRLNKVKLSAYNDYEFVFIVEKKVG